MFGEMGVAKPALKEDYFGDDSDLVVGLREKVEKYAGQSHPEGLKSSLFSIGSGSGSGFIIVVPMRRWTTPNRIMGFCFH